MRLSQSKCIVHIIESVAISFTALDYIEPRVTVCVVCAVYFLYIGLIALLPVVSFARLLMMFISAHHVRYYCSVVAGYSGAR